MITLAIISDIHGNLPALDAVLKDIDERSVDGIYCLGDLTDFAPWGNHVIEKIRSRAIPTLMGNHDQRIAFNEDIIPLAHQSADESNSRLKDINVSKSDISIDNKHWLSTLPFTIEVSYKFGINRKNVLLVHASPDSNDKYIYQDDSKSELARSLVNKEINAIIMGHTHLSYVHNTDGILFVNAGSVGRSKEPDRLATYCILTVTEENLKAEVIKINYDIQSVAKEIYASEIPDFYGDFLLHRY